MPGPTELFGRAGMEGTKLMEQTSKDDRSRWPGRVSRR